MSEMVPCRLCGKRMTLRAMQKHMGHHHEQLALFALPPNLDDTEEDHEEDLSSVSNNDDAGTDEEKIENEANDVSDESEPDEIVDESSLPDRFPGAMADGTQHNNDAEASSEELNALLLGKAFNNYSQQNNMDQTMAAHMSMKQALMDQGDDVPDFAREEEERKTEAEARRNAELAKFDRLESLLMVQTEWQIARDKAKKLTGDHAKEQIELGRQSTLLLLRKMKEEKKNETEAGRSAELAKFDRLESLLMVQIEAQIAKDKAKIQAAEDAAKLAADAKKRSDEDKLASLEKLILAQRDEQLKREAAADAARKAAQEEADAQAEKIAEEKKAAEEKAKKQAGDHAKSRSSLEYQQSSLFDLTKQSATETLPDDISDNSQTSLSHRTQPYKYDPRIGNLFAAHQDELQQHQVGGKLIDTEPDASDSEVTADGPSPRDRLVDIEEERSRFEPPSVKNEQQSTKEKNTAVEGTPVYCQHTFKAVKSDTTFVVWLCNTCHSGPHSLIYECSSCKLRVCRPCASKAPDVVTERRSTSGYDIQPEAEPVSDQKEFTGSASKVDITPVVPSGQGSIQMMTTQNQQGLNVQIPMDVQDEDGSESPSVNRHKCPHCSREFTRQHNLESHMLTHSQEKPYECPTCQARFKRLFDLNRHTKIHISERPHTCLKCGRRFARSDSLARHNQAGCAGRQSSLDIDQDMVDGKGDEGTDGAVYTNELDEGYGDNGDEEGSKDTVQPLQKRSPEDAELVKERERLIREDKQMKDLGNMENSGREDESGGVAEKEKRLAEERIIERAIDEYKQRKVLEKAENSGRERDTGQMTEEEARLAEERVISDYRQWQDRNKILKLGRKNEAESEGETSKQMSRELEGASIDAGFNLRRKFTVWDWAKGLFDREGLMREIRDSIEIIDTEDTGEGAK